LSPDFYRQQGSSANLLPAGPLRHGSILVWLFWILSAGSACGATLELVPSVEVRQEYNDNIFLTETARIDDFITTVSPGFSLISGSESLQSGLSARVERILYGENSDLNAWDQNYRGWYGRRITPRLHLSAEGEYTRDSRPDRDLLTTGLVLSAVNRERRQLSLSGEYRFSERTQATLSYGFQENEYQSAAFTDSRSHSVNLGFSNRLTPVTIGQLNFGYARHRFADSTVENYTATVGTTLEGSERWNLFFAVGGRLTRSEWEVAQLEFVPPASFRLVTVEQRDQDWGLVGRGGLSVQGELTRGTLTLSRDVMTASGRSGATERSALTLNLTRQVTPRLSGRLSAGAYLNQSGRGEFATTPIDEKTFRVSPVIHYEFSKEMFVEGSYAFTRIEDKQADSNTEQSLWLLRFSFRHSLL